MSLNKINVPSTVPCRKTRTISPPLLVPTILSLSSTQYYLNQPKVPIYVYGGNFRPYSVVTMDEFPCETFYNNSVVLGFFIAPQINSEGSYLVQVQNINYAPNGGIPNNNYLSSNKILFSVEPPVTKEE